MRMSNFAWLLHWLPLKRDRTTKDNALQRQADERAARRERRRQIEEELDPHGSVRRSAWYNGTVEEWEEYVDWVLTQREQQEQRAEEGNDTKSTIRGLLPPPDAP
jgi:hypothetical protein